MQTPHALDGNVRFFERQFNPHFGGDVLAEVSPFLKCQLTYSKGWPARATQSHKMARFGDDGVAYSFKGTQKPVHPWQGGKLGLLKYYRDEIEKLIGWRANCCVANTYTSDGDLFPHRDSQYIPELGDNPTIVSISFGETRDFLVWELDEKGKRKMPYTAIRLAPGDLLVMETSSMLVFTTASSPNQIAPDFGCRLRIVSTCNERTTEMTRGTLKVPRWLAQHL